MRAVWSFWAKPFARREGSVWLSDYHALLSWVLSVETARRHYPDTALVTDDAGADLLLGRLRLPFRSVSLELNRLRDRDADWWALGKLYAYRLQTRPFVHLDADVFLWERLPAALESAEVFAQSPETFSPDEAGHWYPVRAVEATLLPRGGWLPRAWLWYSASPPPLQASCCGIVGGTRVELLAEWADLGIRVAEAQANAGGWARWPSKGNCNVLIEQFLLGAVVAHRRHHPRRPGDERLRVEHLFAGDGDPYAPANAERAGYTHLIAGAKRDPELLAHLEARVRAEYPDLAERCTWWRDWWATARGAPSCG
jgi:hypothetical protein